MLLLIVGDWRIGFGGEEDADEDGCGREESGKLAAKMIFIWVTS